VSRGYDFPGVPISRQKRAFQQKQTTTNPSTNNHNHFLRVMERENLLQKALEAIGKYETLTLTAVARKFGVSYTTLRRRHRGTQAPTRASHEHQMNLTMAQEAAVVSWIGKLTAKGFPPNRAILQHRIQVVRLMFNPYASPLGKNYVSSFISRHPELGFGYASRRDKNRAIKGARSVYEDFFNKVCLVLMVLSLQLTLASSGIKRSKNTICCPKIYII
jgi:helix-turn-helix, Psq domain